MRKWKSYLVDLAMNDCAARGINLPAGLKQAGRTWPILAVRIQSQCAAGREAREETLMSNIITFSPTGSTHTDANTDLQGYCSFHFNTAEPHVLQTDDKRSWVLCKMTLSSFLSFFFFSRWIKLCCLWLWKFEEASSSSNAKRETL